MTDPTVRNPAGGSLTIADRVVERIAAHAAGEVEHVLARRPSNPRRSWPGAAGLVDGRWVRLDVTVSVQYPNPLRRVTAAVRDRVATTVAAATGLDVKEVDVRVLSLDVAAPESRRVL